MTNKKFMFFAAFIAVLIATGIWPARTAVYAEEEDYSVYICDEIFLREIYRQTNISFGEPLTFDDLNRVTRVILDTPARCLVGIEYLTNLEELIAPNNNLTELDITHNTNLRRINVHRNYFEDESGIVGWSGWQDVVTLDFSNQGEGGWPPAPHDDCLRFGTVFTPIQTAAPTREPAPVPSDTPPPAPAETYADASNDSGNAEEPPQSGQSPTPMPTPIPAAEESPISVILKWFFPVIALIEFNIIIWLIIKRKSKT